jgi:rhodanese-related sulfurtransferase
MVAWLSFYGCDSGNGSSKTESATDADNNTDISTNNDSDTDADSDADTDADSDADSDSVSPWDTGVPDAWPDGKYITIEEVYARVQANDPEMLLINVVDEVFYNLGHIEGSLKITWDTLEANLDEVDSTRHIVIYCRRGVRSESAYTTLVDNGYPHVWVMENGIEAWIAAGYPTVPE